MKKRFLSILLSLCMLIQLLPATALFSSAAEVPESLWEYQSYEDGVMLTAYLGDAIDVYVPSFVEDENGERLPVLKLGDSLFEDNDALNSATLGAGITEIGERAFYDCDNLVCIVTNEELTSIGAQAFDSCDTFNSVILRDTVTTIAEDAFANCPTVTIWCNENSSAYLHATTYSIPYEILNPDATPETYVENGITYYILNGEAYAIEFDGSSTDVVIPAIVQGYPVVSVKTAFRGSKITSIVLPESVTKIDDYAFYCCYSLKEFTFPKGLTSIGEYSFYRCEILERIDLPQHLTYIGAYAFYACNNAQGEIIIPQGISAINDYSFGACTSVSGYQFPSTLKTIGAHAFWGYPLSTINLPDGVETIGSGAFARSKLTEVTFPNSATTLVSAFYDCDKLTEVTVPSGITDAPGLFEGCDNLKKVTIEDGATTIFKRMFRNCPALTEVILPDTITAIGGSAFWGCASLTEFEVPKNVTTISGYAFERCGKLTNVTLPEGLTTIGEGAFRDCKSLELLTIPQSVTFVDVGTIPAYTVLCVYEGSYAHIKAVEKEHLYFLTKENAAPEFYTVNGIKYYIQNEEAIIIGFDNASTDIVIPNAINGYPVVGIKYGFSGTDIKSITLPKTLTSVPTSCFSHCTELTSITIPGGVKTIEQNTFCGCSSLTSVTLCEGVEKINMSAFENCTKLTDVTLPETVASISSLAFKGCSKLTTLTIPKSVTKMYADSVADHIILLVYSGSFAHSLAVEENLPYFEITDEITDTEVHTVDGVTYFIKNNEATAIRYDGSVTNLTIPTDIEGYPVVDIGTVFRESAIQSIVLPETVTMIDENAFRACTVLEQITLPASITSIGAYAFRDCYVLKQITIPDQVSAIGKYAFYGCKRLDNVVIPEGVTVINDYTFYECRALKNLSLPSTLKRIGDHVFRECAFTTINIPSGVESIGKNAFILSKLTEVTIPESVTDLGQSAFMWCHDLETVLLPDGLTAIPHSVFIDCQSLTNIIIPDTVTSIGRYAFAECYHLKNISIPDSVTSIAMESFRNCTKLAEITIPGSVTVIKESTFQNCTSLKSVTLSENCTSIGANAFDRCSSLATVIVPDSVTSLDVTSFPANTILMVSENSYAHTFAVENDLLYFILRKTENPEIAFGTGLSGTVTYTDGTPAVGATVEIVYDDGVAKETVTTDDTGAYAFAYAEVGRYNIQAVDANGNTASTSAAVKRMNAFDVFLEGDTSLTLKRGWTVSGTVSETATVTLTDMDGNILAVVDAADSSFSFGDVPNGEYILKAESEHGAIAQEITVFDGNLSDLSLVIPTETVTIWGYVEVEDRDFVHHRRNWVQVTLYNSEGVAVSQIKSDHDGKYTFSHLPTGEYTLVAETAEMRPDKKHGYDRSHSLTGYAYVDATAAGTYQAETIVLYEENDKNATISGKVTAQGESQACEVILRNVFRHEIAKCTTGNNGKYSFKNVCDGLYFIIAITASDGMGMRVVMVRNGKVYGETDIFVYKHDKIRDWEDKFHERIPTCANRNDALNHREKIAEEKRWYDKLSEKEKKQLSKAYVERLDKLCKWISGGDCTADEDITVNQSGLVVSGEELENGDTVSFELKVEKKDAHTPSTDGVYNRDDFIHHGIEDAAGDHEIKQYYEISMHKTVSGETREITSIRKDTDSCGKFRITLPIPEEYRGHKHYSVIHVHHGKPMTLTDLDDDPNTITFEIDEFSTFVLTGTDVTLVADPTDYDIAVATNGGAQIRTTGTQGLRFISTIDKTSLDFNRVVEFGTLLLPTADLNDDPNQLVVGYTNNGHSAAKVPARNLYADTDTTTTFTAVLINIPTSQYACSITARAYALLDDGTYMYSDTTTSRSIYEVAINGRNAGATGAELELFEQIIGIVEGLQS